MTFQLAFNGRRKAKPKPTRAAPKLLDHVCWFHDAGPDSMWILQLPLVVHAQHGYARQHYAIASKSKGEHIGLVIRALRTQLRGVERERIDCVTFVRFCAKPMDEDNLQTAFKHVKDAVAAWIETGGDYNRKHIGIYDGQIDQRTGKAFKWLYENVQHETNKRLQGIQIRLRLGSEAR